MNSYSTERTLFHACFWVLVILLVSSLVFAALFTLLPLNGKILPLFSHVALALASFCGSFAQARATPFFKASRPILLSFVIIVALAATSLFFGVFSPSSLLKKGVSVLLSVFCGEFFGRTR